MKRPVRCVLALIATVSAVGCTNHATRRATPPTTGSTGTGATSLTPGSTSVPPGRIGFSICSHEGYGVEGSLEQVGGPPGAASSPTPGTVTATRIPIVGARPYVCRVTVGSDGRFSMILPPGRYRITGRSPNFDNGQVDCAAPGDVVVFAPSATGAVANGQNMFLTVDCERR